MSSVATTAARRGRSIPLLYGIITAVVIVVVAAVALVVRPPTPPSVAEFAPDAKQVDEGRDDQGAPKPNAECRGSGCEKAGGLGATPTTIVGNDGKPRRKCYGDPPRQTPDPHSPPCISEIFRGDNGGATSRGVDSTTIKVAIMAGSASEQALWRPLIDAANRSFELYGRSIAPVFMNLNWQQDPEAKAAAIEAQEPFAVLGGYFNTAQDQVDAIARRRMLVVSSSNDAMHENQLAATKDFAWGAGRDFDEAAVGAASIVCNSMRARPAKFAGDGMADKTRKFGVATYSYSPGDDTSDPSTLLRGLAACGIHPSVRQLELVGTANFNSGNQQAMVAFKAEGVTTILNVDDLAGSGTRGLDASNAAGYHPEYFDIAGITEGLNDYDADTRHRVFGITDDTRLMKTSETREAAFAGGNERGDDQLYYDELLLLASGIQLAGQTLTPANFAKGLHGATFPNPGFGQAPYFQQRVGFKDDHVFRDDLILWWWSDDAPKTEPDYANNTKGSACYVNKGKRFLPDDPPTEVDNLLFNAKLPCQ